MGYLYLVAQLAAGGRRRAVFRCWLVKDTASAGNSFYFNRKSFTLFRIDLLPRIRKVFKLSDINLGFIILWSILCLASCSETEPGEVLLTGAFGLSFGEQPEGFDGSFLSELKSIEAAPPLPDNRFEKYFFTVTPGSHRIYQISAATAASLNKAACDALLDDLAIELMQEYYKTDEAIINATADKWVLQRNTKRSVSLQCLAAPATAAAGKKQLYRLSVSYLDYNLATEAYREWNKKTR